MSLDAVKITDDFESKSFAPATAIFKSFEKWQNFPVSNISHHGTICCEIAREWLHDMDYSQLSTASVFSGPRWILQRYSWGPTKWPLHWCEAVAQKSLDCGAQSAVAHEIFKMRGVQSYRVQLVQEFSEDTTRQWSERWTEADTSVFWLAENLIYHECCAVITGGDEVKLWDGSASCWVSPRQFKGYGAVRALRLYGAPGVTEVFQWGDHVVRSDIWQEIVNR